MSDIQTGMSVEITTGDNAGKSMTVDSIEDGMANGEIEGKDVSVKLEEVKQVSTGA